jgi:hypothetical protein
VGTVPEEWIPGAIAGDEHWADGAPSSYECDQASMPDAQYAVLTVLDEKRCLFALLSAGNHACSFARCGTVDSYRALGPPRSWPM